MNPRPHIIHQLTVEVSVPSEQFANQVKDEISKILRDDVLPELEKYLDSLDVGEETLRIDKLKIDIGELAPERIEYEFENLILSSFRQITGKLPFIAKQPGDSLQLNYPARFDLFAPDSQNESEVTVDKVSLLNQTLETLLYFLETGRLPWHVPASGMIRVEEHILAEEKILALFSDNINLLPDNPILRRIHSLLKSNAAALERLFSQFSHILTDHLLSVLMEKDVFTKLKFSSGKISDAFQEEPVIVEETLQIFWREAARRFFTQPGIENWHHISIILDQVITYFRKHAYPESILKKLEEIRRNSLNDSGINSSTKLFRADSVFQEDKNHDMPERKERSSDKKKLEGVFGEKQEGIFVQNAGMILLHPFLKYFFMDFGLLEEDRFKGRHEQQSAVHLLHYLVTKETFAPEYKLTLEKFLCGYPLDEPIERVIEITEKMKAESENLLDALIRNWPQLKNTSPDGLREGFLRRDGKLIPDDYQPRLIVENKAQDVLLSFLPWGYSIVKLPWMENPLFVDWNY